MPSKTTQSYLASTLIVAASVLCAAAAKATTINLSYTGMNGYSAQGSFTYNGATAPAVIAEMGSGPTVAIQSFNISFFSPTHALLETGSSVVNGVSSDRFFQLTYNTATNTISVLDGDIGGSSYQYFLTNLRTPTGSTVAPGLTTFNFFLRSSANAALDTAATVTSSVSTAVAAVPEPSTWLELLVGAGAVVALRVFSWGWSRKTLSA